MKYISQICTLTSAFAFVRHVSVSYDINSATHVPKLEGVVTGILPFAKSFFSGYSDGTWTHHHPALWRLINALFMNLYGFIHWFGWNRIMLYGDDICFLPAVLPVLAAKSPLTTANQPWLAVVTSVSQEQRRRVTVLKWLWSFLVVRYH